MRLAFEDDAESQHPETAGHQPVLVRCQVLDLTEMADQAGHDQGHRDEKQQQGKR